MKLFGFPDAHQKPLMRSLCRRDFASASLIFFVFFGLSFLKHFLLHSHVFDLGLYEQWSSLAGQGRWLEQGSLFLGISRGGDLLFGDHFSLLLLPIGLLYRLLPSTVTLLLVQSFALAVGFFLVARMPWASAGVRSREFPNMLLLFILSPIFYNSSLDLFSFEAVAFPLLYVSISFFLRDKFGYGAIFLVVGLIAKDYVGVWGLGVGLYLLVKKKFVSGAFAFVVSGTWLWLSLALNTGNHNKVSDRLIGNAIGLGSADQSAASVVESLFRLLPDPSHSILYVFIVMLPLLFVFKQSSLPAIVGASPILLVNIVSTADTMRSLIYHYQLPVFFWIVIAFRDSSFNLEIPFLSLRSSLLRWLFGGSLICYFFFFAQYQQPFTSWWSRAQSAFELSAIRGQVVLAAQQHVSKGGRGLCDFYTDGSIAPHFAGIEGVCWLPSQLPDSDRLPYVFLPRSPKNDRQSHSLMRLVFNRIFNYGHGSYPYFDAQIEEFYSGKYGQYSCRGFGGRPDSTFVECTPKS